MGAGLVELTLFFFKDRAAREPPFVFRVRPVRKKWSLIVRLLRGCGLSTRGALVEAAALALQRAADFLIGGLFPPDFSNFT